MPPPCIRSYPLEDPPTPSMSKRVSISVLPIPGGSRENPAPGPTPHSFHGYILHELSMASLWILISKLKNYATDRAFQLYFTITHSKNCISIAHFICKYVFPHKNKGYSYATGCTLLFFYFILFVSFNTGHSSLIDFTTPVGHDLQFENPF